MIQGSSTVVIERSLNPASMTAAQRRAASDSKGNLINTKTLVTLNNVKIAWGSTSTSWTTNNNETQTDVTLYFPRGTVIEDDDVFIINGERYLPDGIAIKWDRPRNFSRIVPGVIIGANREEK